MSSKPNAEASSLGYAEAPLIFNSVETIPNLNASEAFKVDSGKVFKEDMDIIVPVVINERLSYVPWGGDNALPTYFLGVCQDFKHFAFCTNLNKKT